MSLKKLHTRRLGKSGFQVTEIGIGLWAIGGSEWGPVDDQNSLDTIEAALGRESPSSIPRMFTGWAIVNSFWDNR